MNHCIGSAHGSWTGLVIPTATSIRFDLVQLGLVWFVWHTNQFNRLTTYYIKSIEFEFVPSHILPTW
ncbi:unnamed protein product [Linum trigynum]|uniref:Uncharacterized protein n=1 Tax=Linum trigynum TaxID=586398 RepID=A0AAV2GLP8_9ROSI